MQDNDRIFRNDDGHWAVTTSIEINAAPHDVWETLTDFLAMPEWSDNLQGIDGDFHDGGVITAHFKMGSRIRSYDHTVSVEPGRSFWWSDRYAPGLSDHHVYRVDGIDGGTRTRFVNTDVAKGPTARLVGKSIMRSSMEVYQAFNQALKDRVEGMA